MLFFSLRKKLLSFDCTCKPNTVLSNLKFTKAELMQLKINPIICLMKFIDEKVGNQKSHLKNNTIKGTREL